MRHSLKLVVLPMMLLISAHAGAAVIEVVKSPYCGCCAKWVEYLKQRGMDVRVTDSEQVTALKDRLKIPARLRSCHTAKVGGYVVEGHVPAEDIARLLKERPKAIGIAVAGMPAGAPGMEHAEHKGHFQTILFTGTGEKLFAAH